jgi:hypothetical protein
MIFDLYATEIPKNRSGKRGSGGEDPERWEKMKKHLTPLR